MNLIVGNIIALIASILMVYTGIIKTKKKILYVQSIQIGLLTISNIILGGITGAIVNALSFIRNIICYKGKLDIKWKIIFTFLTITFTFYFNNMKLIGLLPLISTLSYLWFMDMKNIINFKLLIIFTMIMWGIYDFNIKSYTSFIFDFLNVIANIYTIYKINYKKVSRK